VTPAGNAKLISKASRSLQIDECDWHEGVESGAVRVVVTPAFHWSRRTAFDTNQALWGAFVVETDVGSVYFAGDTGFGDGVIFREVRRRYGAPRLSLLPIGAYEPRWFMKPQHMNPAEAVEAHALLESGTSLAIHHGTIQLTDEPIDAPPKALAQALTERNIDPSRFLVPDVGETISIP
jgi:L-ascorbate metabolism protein UlaG (beta-lactamase superfamily)